MHNISSLFRTVIKGSKPLERSVLFSFKYSNCQMKARLEDLRLKRAQIIFRDTTTRLRLDDKYRRRLKALIYLDLFPPKCQPQSLFFSIFESIDKVLLNNLQFVKAKPSSRASMKRGLQNSIQKHRCCRVGTSLGSGSKAWVEL